MFRSLRQMTGYAVHSKDGQAIGAVSDFLFDDLRWILRYLVLDSSQVFERKRVLLSPVVFGLPDREQEIFPVRLEADKIAASPDISGVDPITRKYETEIHQYYQWPAYWEEAHEVPPTQEGMTGWSITEMMIDVEAQRKDQGGEQNPYLRSFEEALSYTIRTRDNENAGDLYDLLVHEQNWRISYMVITTNGLLPGRKVVLSPASITHFDWENSRLELDLSQETIHNGQEYNPDIPFERTADEDIYQEDPNRRDR
jgi:uncharacterized protein YrrD